MVRGARYPAPGLGRGQDHQGAGDLQSCRRRQEAPEHDYGLHRRVRFICVDLLAGSMEGSESDSEVVSAWVRGCQEIVTDTGAALLHVTHSGYSAAGGGHAASSLRSGGLSRRALDRRLFRTTWYLNGKKNNDQPADPRLQASPGSRVRRRHTSGHDPLEVTSSRRANNQERAVILERPGVAKLVIRARLKIGCPPWGRAGMA